MSSNETRVVRVLKNGGFAVLPTDTIYGIHAFALDKKTVEKAYKVTKRTSFKPFIVLISSVKDLKKFDIKLDKKTKRFLKDKWPARLSVVLPCKSEEFKYLHRGTKTLAFRVPDKKSLVALLKKTGPLISTSANPEGEKPAKNIKEAKDHFGKKVNIYINEGELKSPPSTVIKLTNGKIKTLRKGAVKINQVAL